MILLPIHYSDEFFNGQDKTEIDIIYLFAVPTVICGPASVAYQNTGGLLVHPSSSGNSFNINALMGQSVKTNTIQRISLSSLTVSPSPL